MAMTTGAMHDRRKDMGRFEELTQEELLETDGGFVGTIIAGVALTYTIIYYCGYVYGRFSH